MKVIYRYHLSKNLQKIKKDKNLTTKQIAKGSGLSQTTIYNWEKMKTEPILNNLKKLADFLDISIDKLIGYKKGKFN